MISLYAVGILVAVVVSNIFSRLVIKGEDTPFVMELPPYRMPTAQAIGRHTWDKGKEYLKKMGGIILVASIIVWTLQYFPHDDTLTTQQQQEQSYIGRLGKAIEPVFKPQGFNWKLDVSLIAGVGAKEIVASTLGVIYSDDDSFADDESFSDDSEKYSRLRQQMFDDGVFGTPKEKEIISQRYAECDNISVDYAIMEKAEEIFVCPADFGWSDLGTWGSLHTLVKKDANKNGVISQAAVRTFDTVNCIINVGGLKEVVVQGLDGYIVAERDGKLLICKLSEEQRIKEFQ